MPNRRRAARAASSPQLGSGVPIRDPRRLFDLAASLLLLVIVSPMMALLAACIYVEDGGPVLFVQPRVGRGGRTFGCLKFRSMGVDAADRMAALLAASPEARAEYARNRKLRRDPRVTAVGRLARQWSLDELPQLINVIRGEMSLVGPRPIMVEEQAAYGRRLQLYAQVRPGITGLWQVSGRSHRSFRSRVAMDVLYLRSRSAWRDLAILARTLTVVASRHGSY